MHVCNRETSNVDWILFVLSIAIIEEDKGEKDSNKELTSKNSYTWSVSIHYHRNDNHYICLEHKNMLARHQSPLIRYSLSTVPDWTECRNVQVISQLTQRLSYYKERPGGRTRQKHVQARGHITFCETGLGTFTMLTILVVLVTQDHGTGFTYAENFLYVHDACPLLMPSQCACRCPMLLLQKGVWLGVRSACEVTVKDNDTRQYARTVAASISSTSLTPAMRQQTPRVEKRSPWQAQVGQAEQKLVRGKWHVKRASVCVQHARAFCLEPCRAATQSAV